MMVFKLDKTIHNIFLAILIPGLFVAFWLTDLICLTSCKLCLVAFFVVFLIIPIVFKYSYYLQKHILFLTFIAYPSAGDLKQPEKHGLYATRNFYVDYEDKDEEKDINLGCWHVLPNDLAKKYASQLKVEAEIETDNSDVVAAKSDKKYLGIEKLLENPGFNISNEKWRKEFFEEALRSSTNDVVLYLHGNTASRGAPHRVEMYQMLRKLNYHVISIDYRGYGDSCPVPPHEKGVVYDALAVYQYITTITKAPVYLWGHSLGTGVSTHLLSLLVDMSLQGPRALVLESPFNNIRDEIIHHPLSKLFRNLPWFDMLISRPMYENNLRFESDQHIGEFRQPVLILHAEDDVVVPFHLGYKLYRKALDTRGKAWGPVEFHRFEKTSHYGHKYICHAPELPEMIKLFFTTYRDAEY